MFDFVPSLLPEEYEALKSSIAAHGVEVPIIVDEVGTIIDGRNRQRACNELKVNCPAEVRKFESMAEKLELALRLNCRRRQLSRSQKRDLVKSYLLVDPQIADNHLANLIGGMSKNTVADVRGELEATRQIDKFESYRGADGKSRPRTYKIVTNTAREREQALKLVGDLPPTNQNRTVDFNSARRRSVRLMASRTPDTELVPPLVENGVKLYHCRFQELESNAGIEPASVNMVLTDVPYGQDFLPQLDDIAAFANRVLVDGGLFVCHYGRYYLPQFMQALEKRSLIYRWVLVSSWTGEGSRIASLDIISKSKLVLVYSKGGWIPRRQWSDVLPTIPKEKDRHPWQQPIDDYETLLDNFTNPNDLIVDPCGGGFTTAVACRNLGRRCISCDVDGEWVRRGIERLNVTEPRIAAS